MEPIVPCKTVEAHLQQHSLNGPLASGRRHRLDNLLMKPLLRLYPVTNAALMDGRPARQHVVVVLLFLSVLLLLIAAFLALLAAAVFVIVAVGVTALVVVVIRGAIGPRWPSRGLVVVVALHFSIELFWLAVTLHQSAPYHTFQSFPLFHPLHPAL